MVKGLLGCTGLELLLFSVFGRKDPELSEVVIYLRDVVEDLLRIENLHRHLASLGRLQETKRSELVSFPRFRDLRSGTHAFDGLVYVYLDILDHGLRIPLVARGCFDGTIAQGFVGTMSEFRLRVFPEGLSAISASHLVADLWDHRRRYPEAGTLVKRVFSRRRRPFVLRFLLPEHTWLRIPKRLHSEVIRKIYRRHSLIGCRRFSVGRILILLSCRPGLESYFEVTDWLGRRRALWSNTAGSELLRDLGPFWVESAELGRRSIDHVVLYPISRRTAIP